MYLSMSCHEGGLLNVGPKADGTLIDVFQGRLRDIPRISRHGEFYWVFKIPGGFHADTNKAMGGNAAPPRGRMKHLPTGIRASSRQRRPGNSLPTPSTTKQQ